MKVERGLNSRRERNKKGENDRQVKGMVVR